MPGSGRPCGAVFVQLMDQGLQAFPYPPETPDMDGEEQLSSSSRVGVSVALPDSVIFLETPQVARWDDAGKPPPPSLELVQTELIRHHQKLKRFFHPGKQWRLDGIGDVAYDKDEAKISVKMASFQPLVLLQETYANFPFQSWELRPLGQDVALFTIRGALIELSIEIQVTDANPRPKLGESISDHSFGHI